MSETDGGGRIVECPVHGDAGPAYICRHLNLEMPVGFIEGYDADDPDAELFQAWCADCNEVLEAEGEWNERSEAFAAPRLVCRGCYRDMKLLNRQA